MSEIDTDDVTRAVAELGEPDAAFTISPGRLLAKLAVGCLLVFVGVVANYVWCVHGPRTFGHLELILLFGPPAVGVSLLLHMHRNRGLTVLVYPTGLLRLRRGEVDSYPWAEVADVRLKLNRSETATVERGADGRPVSAWFAADVPTFQIWKAGLTLERADGEEAHFGPALSAFDRLSEEVQRRTFAALWPPTWLAYSDGLPVAFGELAVGPSGLSHGEKLLPWAAVGDVTVTQGKLSVKRAGKWLPWALVDVAAVANPHVLAALVEEAKRTAVAVPQTTEDEDGED